MEQKRIGWRRDATAVTKKSTSFKTTKQNKKKRQEKKESREWGEKWNDNSLEREKERRSSTTKREKKKESKNMKVKATCSERAGPRRLWPVSKVASSASCHGMQRILECHRRAEPRHAPKELELRIHAESVVNQRDWVSTTKKKKEKFTSTNLKKKGLTNKKRTSPWKEALNGTC